MKSTKRGRWLSLGEAGYVCRGVIRERVAGTVVLPLFLSREVLVEF